MASVPTSLVNPQVIGPMYHLFPGDLYRCPSELTPKACISRRLIKDSGDGTALTFGDLAI